VLFSTLGDYESFGWVASMAALASAAASFACGKALDRGNRQRYLKLASAVTAGRVLLRALSFGSPTLSVVASVSGAAVSALYAPVVMSVIYARAKSSGEPYRFHLALEPAWDVGMIGGSAVAACVAAWSPIPSLCVLPSMLGVAIVYLSIAGIRPSRKTPISGYALCEAPAGP
jgi:MFS family permease